MISDEEMNRAICLKLPAIGWKEGEKCGRVDNDGYCNIHNYSVAGIWTRGTHDIPPPDLLANPWLLVEALWKHGIDVEFTTLRVELWRRDYQAPPDAEFADSTLLSDTTIKNGDLARALRDAAHALLCEGKA